MKHFTIYHNPHCSKSRATLNLLRDNRIEPTIILYIDTPPSADELKSLLVRLRMKPRELLRTSEADYKILALDDISLTDEALIHAMSTHPTLIERPIVAADTKAVIGRPPENVLELINE